MASEEKIFDYFFVCKFNVSVAMATNPIPSLD